MRCVTESVDGPLVVLGVDGVGVDGDLGEELMEQPQEARVADAQGLLNERRVCESGPQWVSRSKGFASLTLRAGK